MPRDSRDEAQVEKWQQLLDDNPKLADNLEAWYEAHSKLHILRQDEQLMQQFDEEYRSEKMAATCAAMMLFAGLKQKDVIGEEMAALRARAAKSKRRLTPRESRKIEELQGRLRQLDEKSETITSSNKELFEAECDRLYKRELKRQLDSGLLMTDQMKEVIEESLPAMMRGEPALFVGETGGAKTALAEYIVYQHFGVEPEFISAYGDVNSYQLMGKQELREENGASVSEFMPGPIVRAMEQGRPLILDEINAMPPELLKRLNKIMQLRPGDKFSVQEDSRRIVEVQPGFCIIATANEKSMRYKGVDDLSVEFQNRFGANIYRVRYPDHASGYEDYPRENAQLATASIVDERGEQSPYIEEAQLNDFIKVAFISQQLFAGTHGRGYNQFIASEKIVDNLPGLEETVIAPRTMVEILQKVDGSFGVTPLSKACWRFMDGVKNPNDRSVFMQLFKYHNLLTDELMARYKLEDEVETEEKES